ncbi:MAG TPA: MFS transporter, partial [Arthrobacter sp.]|nr:MFS transporter [Arthrobacter sp.]
MPIDQSKIVSPDGARNADGNPAAATTPAAADTVKNSKKMKLRPKRRLKESDVNVVDQPMLKKALGGTIVGNTMEWYDVGVFGYLITTMGPVFLPEADKSVQTLFLLGTFAATFIARPLGGVVFGWLGDKV